MNKKLPFKYSTLALATALISQSNVILASEPVTPIKHLIVVVGENVAFDTLYATYKAPKGQTVNNLLSQHIINADGTPGVHFAKALQRQASNPSDQYTVRPTLGAPYVTLPQPLQTGILDASTLTFKEASPDARFPATLPNGPFQITKYVPYGSAASATGDPAHRFFQMWQQTGGNNLNHSLFTWVGNTTGIGGDNGPDSPTPEKTQQGAELMGFFNMAKGDAPLFKQLAQTYALSDNFHQAIMGGTGANFFALATGDVAVYNKDGSLAVPPAWQIENPNPKVGTENFYTHDGYKGGSYVKCFDIKQPGVKSILKVLRKGKISSNCQKNAYYLVNNYDMPYNIDGTEKTLTDDVTIYPPQAVPTIGEALSAKSISWTWYTGGRDAADVLSDGIYPLIRASINAQIPTTVPEPDRTQMVDGKAFATTQSSVYNAIGDPHNASKALVTTPSLRAHLKGMDSFLQDVTNDTLPAVSYVVPKNLDSGHPGYSAPVSYELFIKDLVAAVQAKPALWADTAILITTDEGGGYFDTGYIQNVDFFGDGPRIPFLVVSPFAKKGYVDHVYHDHASILKFIEYNWGLAPLSSRSRDNLPNPITSKQVYRPDNQPAIGDLTSLFDFSNVKTN